MKLTGKLKTYLLVLTAVAAPLVFFSSNFTPWRTSGVVVTSAQQILDPFARLWTNSITFVTESYSRYVDLVETEKENEILRSKLRELQGRIIDYQSQAIEIDRLRELLGFKKSFTRSSVVAEVSYSGKNSVFPILRVNRGSLHEVSVGMPVITPDGIVGRILRVGPLYSDVQLVSDPNFSVDAIVERTRIRAVLNGHLDNKLHLELTRKTDIKIGDTIVTSGIVGSYPKGLPVGKVIKVSYETDQLAQRITVEPFANYRTIEEVMILLTSDDRIKQIRQAAGEEWIRKNTEVEGG